MGEDLHFRYLKCLVSFGYNISTPSIEHQIPKHSFRSCLISHVSSKNVSLTNTTSRFFNSFALEALQMKFTKYLLRDGRRKINFT